MKDKTTKIRCALVGTGRIGSSLEDDRKREKPASHAGCIHRHSETELVAGADKDPQALNAFGRRWKLREHQLFSDLPEMLDALDMDILHIATHTDSHIELLKLALEAEIPVVILEKPVGETVEEALQILPMLKKSQTRVLVNHERRFSEDYNHVRQLIHRKVYGELRTLNARLYMGRSKEVRKVLWHDGTHMVDIIRYITGHEIDPRQTLGDPESAHENVFLIGKAGSADVILECSPFRDHLHFELDLSFDRGRVRIGNGIYDEQQSLPSPFYESFHSLSSQKRKFSKTGYFINMMSHGVELFKDRARFNRSSFEDGIASIQTIQAFLAIEDNVPFS